MSITVTCECGRINELDDASHPDAESDVSLRRCVGCGRLLGESISNVVYKPGMFQQLWQSRLHESDRDPDTSVPNKSRSLWDVMPIEPPTDARNVEAATTASVDALPNDVELATDRESSAKPKGLWSVMQVAAQPADNAQGASGSTSEEAGETSSAAHRGAQFPLAEHVGIVPHIEVATPEVLSVTSNASPATLGESRSTELSPTTVSRLFREPLVPVEDQRWSVRAVFAFLVALATVLAASCSLQEGILPRLPSLVAGFIGLMLGFTASTEVQRSRGRLKGLAVARLSVLLSALGMFLAPTVFARWGETWRRTAAQEAISSRLRRISEGLDQFHAQHGNFPPAVLMGRATDGLRQPTHGWLTPLLPFIGQQALHQRIDLRQAFDARVNVPAMQQVVEEFVIPGRLPQRSPRGFGVTHFAGVGGTAVRDGIGLVHLGAFGDDQAVRKDQIVDGLSQTLVAGEIADSIPAWGEPGNFRSIGEGLNKQFKGFGNPGGTGATFLHADGSVRFYSTKTDRRVLDKLETRNGSEPIKAPMR